MVAPAEKLAQSLEILKRLQRAKSAGIISAGELSRTHKQRLLASGFLREVLRGWYIVSRPEETKGDSTNWFVSFWHFCAVYLEKRFGRRWSLSPEQSLSLHAGNWSVPRQLVVRSPRARNKITNLLHGTSLLDLRAVMPAPDDLSTKEGLRVFSLEAALIASSPSYFSRNSTDVRAVLLMVRDASGLLSRLLEGGHSTVAGRLAGAFRNVGRDRIAEDIVKTMSAAGYDVRENNPFDDKPIAPSRETSPYANRIRLLWLKMREAIMLRFPKAPGLPRNTDTYMRNLNEAYLTDAYHSLSIEGYRVTPELIQRVRTGKWNPGAHESDRQQRDAMAARGYWQAYQSVQKSVRKILQGKNPGAVVDQDHGTWYRELFSPSVTAGLLKPADLAGYRNAQVYIQKSMHVPPNREAVRDAMPIFFELLSEEDEPSVRIVLGHFMFVYIHPYIDGNGRIGRFLMNVMLASGGYPWTVIPVGERNAYLHALEKASVDGNIVPFVDFIGGLVSRTLAGESFPEVPNIPSQ